MSFSFPLIRFFCPGYCRTAAQVMQAGSGLRWKIAENVRGTFSAQISFIVFLLHVPER